MELDVPEEKNSFFIIDGQHRIAGIGKSNKNYQLGVVILNKVSTDVQSELFITINSEQKAVNPNVRFNMRSNDKFYTPEKMVRNIAEMFNTDAESPFFNKIWMDDTSRKRGELPLSLSAFCEPICAYIYNSKDYYALKDALYKSEGKMEALGDFSAKYGNNILWPLYISENEVVLYKILFNYFKTVYDIYEHVWKDPKSVIIRTTGYNAFIILFKSVFKYCKSDGNNFSYTRMLQILSANRIKDDYFYVPNVGVGRSGAYELYRMLIPKGFGEEQIDSEYMDSLSEDVEEYIV
jgi:DGQHR domain-containing protein